MAYMNEGGGQIPMFAPYTQPQQQRPPWQQMQGMGMGQPQVNPFQQGQQQGLDMGVPGMMNQFGQQRQQRGLNYANSRLSQLQKIAHLTGDPVFQQLFGHMTAGMGDQQAQGGMNPLQLYTQASGQFHDLAQHAGYQDPRQYLQFLLQQAKQGGGGVGRGAQY